MSLELRRRLIYWILHTTATTSQHAVWDDRMWLWSILAKPTTSVNVFNNMDRRVDILKGPGNLWHHSNSVLFVYSVFFKNGNQKDMSTAYEIGLSAHNILAILITIEEGLCDHLERKRIFTLIWMSFASCETLLVKLEMTSYGIAIANQLWQLPIWSLRSNKTKLGSDKHIHTDYARKVSHSGVANIAPNTDFENLLEFQIWPFPCQMEMKQLEGVFTGCCL